MSTSVVVERMSEPDDPPVNRTVFIESSERNVKVLKNSNFLTVLEAIAVVHNETAFYDVSSAGLQAPIFKDYLFHPFPKC